MNAQLVSLFWAALTVFVLSRIGLLAFSKLGDNTGRILMADGIAYVLAALFLPKAFFDTGLPNYAGSFTFYAIPAVIWLIVDLARMAHRRSSVPAG